MLLHQTMQACCSSLSAMPAWQAVSVDPSSHRMGFAAPTAQDALRHHMTAAHLEHISRPPVGIVAQGAAEPARCCASWRCTLLVVRVVQSDGLLALHRDALVRSECSLQLGWYASAVRAFKEICSSCR